MPRSAEGSLPLMLYLIVVGEDSEACSKVTVPPTEESPRRTATMTPGMKGRRQHGVDIDARNGLKGRQSGGKRGVGRDREEKGDGRGVIGAFRCCVCHYGTQ